MGVVSEPVRVFCKAAPLPLSVSGNERQTRGADRKRGRGRQPKRRATAESGGPSCRGGSHDGREYARQIIELWRERVRESLEDVWAESIAAVERAVHRDHLSVVVTVCDHFAVEALQRRVPGVALPCHALGVAPLAQLLPPLLDAAVVYIDAVEALSSARATAALRDAVHLLREPALCAQLRQALLGEDAEHGNSGAPSALSARFVITVRRATSYVWNVHTPPNGDLSMEAGTPSPLPSVLDELLTPRELRLLQFRSVAFPRSSECALRLLEAQALHLPGGLLLGPEVLRGLESSLRHDGAPLSHLLSLIDYAYCVVQTKLLADASPDAVAAWTQTLDAWRREAVPAAQAAHLVSQWTEEPASLLQVYARMLQRPLLADAAFSDALRAAVMRATRDQLQRLFEMWQDRPLLQWLQNPDSMPAVISGDAAKDDAHHPVLEWRQRQQARAASLSRTMAALSTSRRRRQQLESAFQQVHAAPTAMDSLRAHAVQRLCQQCLAPARPPPGLHDDLPCYLNESPPCAHLPPADLRLTMANALERPERYGQSAHHDACILHHILSRHGRRVPLHECQQSFQAQAAAVPLDALDADTRALSLESRFQRAALQLRLVGAYSTTRHQPHGIQRQAFFTAASVE